jgi:hypothetical protein
MESVYCAVRSGSLNITQNNLGISTFNPLNAQLNRICHLLALLGAHHILHVSRIRVKNTKLYFQQKRNNLKQCPLNKTWTDRGPMFVVWCIERFCSGKDRRKFRSDGVKEEHFSSYWKN